MAFFFSCKEQPFLPLLMRWQQATVFREFKRRRRRKGKGEGEEGTKRGRGKEKKEGGSERERERERGNDMREREGEGRGEGYCFAVIHICRLYLYLRRFVSISPTKVEHLWVINILCMQYSCCGTYH